MPGEGSREQENQFEFSILTGIENFVMQGDPRAQPKKQFVSKAYL